MFDENQSLDLFASPVENNSNLNLLSDVATRPREI
jgi:hypothetical protein